MVQWLGSSIASKNSSYKCHYVRNWKKNILCTIILAGKKKDYLLKLICSWFESLD